ncbi:putative uncharacterized protein [Oscillibacter sp. CAG:241]|nr:putative uncharacterized protein [Oscillibacter sp. CAG:241]
MVVTFLHNRIHNVAEEFRRGTFVQRCSQLSFGVLCLFLLECSITGGGRYWEAGPVSIRILLGGLAAVLALPELFRHLGAYLKKPSIWLTLIFVAWLAFCAWLGIRSNNRMDVLITDVKGFMWLFLIPVFVAVVRSRDRLRTLLSWVLAGALIQAALILAVNAAVVLSDNPEPLCRWLTARSIGLVDIVSNKLVRVFFKSSPYMIVGCVVVLFRQARAPKLRWRYVLAVALLFNALLLSYTRSLYGALGLTAVLSITAVLILCPAGRKRVLAFLLAAVVCFGVLVTVQEFVLEGSYLSFAVSRTIGQEVPTSWASQLRGRIRGDISDDKPNDAEMDRQRSYIEVTEKSDQFRQETQDGLKDCIRRSPIIGCGLGAAAASRDSGVDEYFYLDMLARTGIVGLVLYMLPFGYVVLWCLQRRSLLRECPEGAAVVCGLCTFWVVTWFNPWMNAVLGIAWYAVTLSVPQALEEQNA